MVRGLTHTKIIAACLTLFMIAAQTGQGQAVSLGVELACAADYYSYCSKYDPDSPEVRACMRRNGSKLSQRCISALIAAGEVSKQEVARRSTSEHSNTQKQQRPEEE